MKQSYPYIRAWGQMLHSNDSYIVDQTAKAQRDHAPADATYYNPDEKRWHTVAELRTRAATGNAAAEHSLGMVERLAA